MHASIRRYIVASGREADAIKHAQDGIMPILRRQPGFVAYYFINTGDGEMMAVSLHETKEDATRGNELAAKYVGEHMDNTLSRTTIAEGKVVANATHESKP